MDAGFENGCRDDAQPRAKRIDGVWLESGGYERTEGAGERKGIRVGQFFRRPGVHFERCHGRERLRMALRARRVGARVPLWHRRHADAAGHARKLDDRIGFAWWAAAV